MVRDARAIRPASLPPVPTLPTERGPSYTAPAAPATTALASDIASSAAISRPQPVPKTERTYTDAAVLFEAFIAREGRPLPCRRSAEHVEAS